MHTLSSLARSLANGTVSSSQLVEHCLERISATDGEGSRAFLETFTESARATAQAIDLMGKAGTAPSPYAGIPVSVKDLFDVAGYVTRSGSKVLNGQPAALTDATAVARLKRAGFVVIGRTNMTEFAYSGLGLNPHYGTPLGAWDRQTGHVPGGSSSGAAVSVSDGMAHVAIGTDTGGSCRIPAAFNGLVGYKPTAARIPLDGVLPLSTSLDSVGGIGRSVACCAVLDAILADEPAHVLNGSIVGARLALPRTFVLDTLDPIVAASLDAACAKLREAGAIISEIDVPEFAEIPTINAKGGFSAAGSFAWHRELLASDGARYDPRVKVRIEAGAGQSAVDYIDLVNARSHFIARVSARLEGYDAMICPTTPVTPPPLSACDTDAAYSRLNALCLRNPAVVNLLDGCSISLPMGDSDGPPVGLMVSAFHGHDRTLFRIAHAVERTLQAD